MKLLLITGLMLFAFGQTRAQLINIGSPIKTAQIDNGKGVTSYKDSIWCVYNIYDLTDKTHYLKIAKYNGLFWADYYSLKAKNGSRNVIQMQDYKGDLYFTSHFDDITLSSGSYSDIHGVFKWDGVQVSLIETFSFTFNFATPRSFDLDTFMGELYLGGNFDSIGGVAMKGIVKYDGTNWTEIGTAAQRNDFRPSGKMVHNNGRLLIQGDTVDNYSTRYYGMASYDGVNLSPVDSAELHGGNFRYVARAYSHPDSINYYVNYGMPSINGYCQPGKDVHEINEPTLPYYTIVNQHEEHYAYRGESIYAMQPSFTFDNVNRSLPIIQKFTGKNVKRLVPPNHLSMEDFFEGIGMFGKEGVFCHLINRNNNDKREFYQIGTDDRLSSTISGRAYVDINGNCKYDAGDKPLVNKWVNVQSDSNVYPHALTDSAGAYMIGGLGAGPDTLTISGVKGKLNVCNSQNDYPFVITKDTNLIRDFIYKYDSTVRDIAVSTYAQFGNRVRRGFLDRYFVKVNNNGYLARSGSVEVTVDTNFIDISALGSNLSLNGNILTFTYTDLKPDEEVQSTWLMRIPITVPLESKVNLDAQLDSATMVWDTENSNNWDYNKLEVRASYDPNDKTSFPEGDILPGTENITYHINFQNMGNDTAYRVVIVDTIDARLPLEKISIAASSHPFQLKIRENILIFEFDNIDLVDSTTNEPLSKGFIRFHAKLPKNLPLGAKVDNRAHIYFDYNTAITTNIASVLVAKPSNISAVEMNELKIYPNPTRGVLNIENENNATSAIIYSTTGKQVQKIHLKDGLNTINIESIPTGIYLIKLEGENTLTKVQVLH